MPSFPIEGIQYMKVKNLKPEAHMLPSLVVLLPCGVLLGVTQGIRLHEESGRNPVTWLLLALIAIAVIVLVKDLRRYRAERAIYRANKDEFDEHLRLRNEIVRELRRYVKEQNSPKYPAWNKWHHKTLYFQAGRFKSYRCEHLHDKDWISHPNGMYVVASVRYFHIAGYSNRPVVIKYDGIRVDEDEAGLVNSQWFSAADMWSELENPLQNRASVSELQDLLDCMQKP